MSETDKNYPPYLDRPEATYDEEGNHKKQDQDQVEHPSHYTDGKYECIDVMEGQFGRKATADFCHLAAFKYIWRAGRKAEQGKSIAEKQIEDLRKAEWYLKKEINLLTDLKV